MSDGPAQRLGASLGDELTHPGRLVRSPDHEQYDGDSAGSAIGCQIRHIRRICCRGPRRAAEGSGRSAPSASWSLSVVVQ
jgi:hypothetical protein